MGNKQYTKKNYEVMDTYSLEMGLRGLGCVENRIEEIVRAVRSHEALLTATKALVADLRKICTERNHALQAGLKAIKLVEEK